jgi:hypothetical protein
MKSPRPTLTERLKELRSGCDVHRTEFCVDCRWCRIKKQARRFKKTVAEKKP